MRWIEANRAKWVSAYYMRLKNRLAADAFPALGSKGIDAIATKDVLEAIRKIEARGSIETGRRVLQIVSQV